MSEKPESDEFEDEEADEPVIEDGDVDLDQVIKDLDLAKRRGQKAGDPAWRRLERLLEEKHTAELTSDFEDYEIGDEGDAPRRATPQRGRHGWDIAQRAAAAQPRRKSWRSLLLVRNPASASAARPGAPCDR